MTLDKLCQKTNNPAMLNALHACRIGHPWNKAADRPWRNALFLARQQSIFVFSGADIAWLEKQAEREGGD